MKINLAVLFGGKSVEHEISIISAVQAMASMNTEKYSIYPVYITKENELFYGEALKDINEFKDIPSLIKKCQRVDFSIENGKTYLSPHVQKAFSKKPVALIDVAFPIVHGTNVEDGALQGYLRTFNLPIVGCDVLASAVCMDKYTMKAALRYAGFPVLDCVRFSAAEYADAEKIISCTEAHFKYPVIVKPVNLGSSVGITKANNRDGLRDAFTTAFTFADRVIVEPAVVKLKEINCSVLGDGDAAEASECEEPVASDEILTYSDKYLDGGKQSGSKGMASLKRKIPADISGEMREKIRELSVKAFKYLDCCGVARVDYLIDQETNEIYINEFNTIPGSLSFYLWEPLGIKYPELLERMIALALKRQRKEAEIVYSFNTNILSMGGSFGSKGKK